MGPTLGKTLMLGALLITPSLNAQFTYFANGGSVTITAYHGPGGNVTIPNTIDGMPVTMIGEAAFENRTNINVLTIPDTVGYIGPRAFSGCAWLFGVVLPEQLIRIEDQTFNDCFQLTGITIPESVTSIGAYAFYKCAGIRDLTVPDSVRSIGNYAFTWCLRLTNASIGNGVKSIGEHAFARTGLAALDLGRSVQTIGDYAFSYCTNLLSVTVPASVTNLVRAFYGSYRLRCVYFAGDAPYTYDPFAGSFGPIVYYLPGKEGWNSTFGGRPAMPWNPQMQVYASGLTITGQSNLPVVIEACANLANPVWLPISTNTLLGGRALLSDPANLPSRFYRLRPAAQAPYDFEITNSNVRLIHYIGLGGSVRIPDTINGLPVTSIGYGAFWQRSDITEITMPDTVTDIGLLAFSGCINLTNITLSRNITSITGEFYDCRSLRSIHIPAAVTNINSAAFEHCSELTAINVDPANPVYSSAGGVVFDKSRNTLLICPVGKNGSYAVPNTVTNIGARAFYSCIGLTNITIPDSVTDIGDSAFYQCLGLRRIVE